MTTPITPTLPELYDAVVAYEAAMSVFKRAHDWEASGWSVAHDPRDGTPIRGRLEAVTSARWAVLALKIDGRWLAADHRAALRDAVLQRRPASGDELCVTCLGKDGPKYVYEVTVNGEAVRDASRR